MSNGIPFPAPISERIWDLKYRLKEPDGRPVDATLDDTFSRVAKAAAESEPGGRRERDRWAAVFHGAMCDFGFLPAGRILAGAGAKRSVTLFNCFVMGQMEDDLGAIFDAVRDGARTMQLGGGIGQDFSTLRPKGALVRSIGAEASGPVSFMNVWDAMCRTIMSAGARRGAMMGTLRCDHPDIEAFIDAKSDPASLRNFNLSVLVTDAFLDAVARGASWDLVFGGKVYRTLDARALWQRIMRSAYDTAEPGVIFIDRINAANNLRYCETIHATNPCGEQPLPPYGACLLGAINLAALVTKPFTSEASISRPALEERVRTAVRLLDDVIEVSAYPLPAQAAEAKGKRRIGLGLTGLADALVMLGLRYGSDAAAAQAGSWMRTIQHAAYRASCELAAEKGPFPLCDTAALLRAPGLRSLDRRLRAEIKRHGLRNGCLTSIAPTGTISLLAGNVSSGVEPIFDLVHTRRLLGADGRPQEQIVEDFAHARFRMAYGADEPLPGAFVTAQQLAPHDHLRMLAALQPHVDGAISKTINCPPDLPFEAFAGIYLEAHAQGLKGCTAFRPNPVTGAVLQPLAPAGGESGRVASPPAPRPGADHAAVEPMTREPVLAGYTYKLKWPGSDHAIYVTINDMETEGGRRPFEIFINTKNLEHYAWTVALTRMISAVFRRGGDVAFVVEELKAVFDPQGGRWMGGRYVPSLLAAIGGVIESHMVRTGFIEPAAGPRPLSLEVAAPEANVSASSEGNDGARPVAPAHRTAAGGRACQRCGSRSLERREACWSCLDCGFTSCG